MEQNISVVITGANGFVAKNLRKLLYSKKIPVVAIARRNFKTFPQEKKIITANYSQSKILPKIKNSSIMVHLVGIGKQTLDSDYLQINLELTKRIIQICKKSKIKKIIFNSGLGVSKNSTTCYFISKYLAEKAIIHSGLDYTIFRPSYIIGKNDLLSQNLNKQIKSNEIIIPGSGNFYLQPIYVDDVSQIITLALTKTIFKNKIIDMVGPKKVTLKKFVKKYSSLTKIKKIDLEESYFHAINNHNFPYGVDDLNILVGNFQGNFDQLKRISKINFTNYEDVLDTCRLS